MVIRSSQMTGICVGRPSDNSIVVRQTTCCCLFNDWDDGHLTIHDMYQLCFNLWTEHIHSTCSVLVMTSGHIFDNSLRPSCSLWSLSGPIPSVKSDLYSLNNVISMCGLQCTSVHKKMFSYSAWPSIIRKGLLSYRLQFSHMSDNQA